MQQRKALKMQLRCTQQPDYPVPRLLEIYRKPLSWGHLAIRDKMLVPSGVRYAGVEGFYCIYSLIPKPCQKARREPGQSDHVLRDVLTHTHIHMHNTCTPLTHAQLLHSHMHTPHTAHMYSHAHSLLHSLTPSSLTPSFPHYR